MANILVSIISAQTIPNILLIKEWEEVKNVRINKHLLISTNAMSSKIEWIDRVCKLDDRKDIAFLDKEDDITLIQDVLNEKNFSDKDNYIINITGGTKVLSIGVFLYFKRYRNVEFYYVNGNYYLKMPELTGKFEGKIKFQYQISLEHFFNAYGIDIRKQHTFFVGNEYTENFKMQYLKDELYSKHKQAIQFLNSQSSLPFPNYDFNKGYWKENKDIVQNFLKEIKFTSKSTGGLTKNEVSYLSSGWFEEYTYFYIKDILNLSDTAIGMSVEIDNFNLSIKKDEKNPDNELDVAFIYENALHVIECKTIILWQKITDKQRKDIDDLGGKVPTFNNILYKLAAIKDRKQFNLAISAYIYVITGLRDGNDFNEKYAKRADIHDVILLDDSNLKEVFQNNKITKPKPKSNLKEN